MQLLYVCTDFGIPPAGAKGASIHLRSITAALADLGHDVRLLTPLGAAAPDHPATCLDLGKCPALKQCVKPLRSWLNDHDLNEAVAKELRPLLYNLWAFPQALAALTTRPPDAVIERLSLFGHVGLDLSAALHVPLIIEVNALLSEEARQFRSLELGKLAGAIEQRVLSRCDAVLSVSAGLVERLRMLGIPSDKIQVVPNGVDPRHFEIPASRQTNRSALGLTDEFVVGFCGSLKQWHGVDILIDAFHWVLSRDPSARLLIVGAGPAEQDLRRQVETLGISRSVLFTGMVPHQEVPQLLRVMDVAVSPFRSMESFYFSPIKLFEYMAAGNCVVASRLGQMEQVIVDGVNGLLCAPDCSQALAATIERARTSPGLRKRLAEQAARTVREHYTWEAAARTTVRVIDALCRRSSNGRNASTTTTQHAAVEVPS